MKKTLITLLLVLPGALALAADKVPAHPHIQMETSLGTIKLELDGKQAPLTVAHVLELIDSGHYDGTVFHRVIPGFMAQGGGYTPNLKIRDTKGTVPNESGNGLTNVRGPAFGGRAVLHQRRRQRASRPHQGPVPRPLGLHGVWPGHRGHGGRG